MYNTFRHSRLALAAAVTLTGALSGCDDSVAAGGRALAAPQNVQSPVLSADADSVVLVWEKPLAEAESVVDYHVYRQGQLLGSARENQDKFSPAKPYIDNFYQKLDHDNWQHKVSLRTFTADGLNADTDYPFTVRAVYSDGKESADSLPITVRTTKAPNIIDVRTTGAIGDGKTLDTVAIQKAIDSCTVTLYPQGCKVSVSGGVFKTGALFLHSDMTLEIAEGATLLGSDDPAQYPLDKGYYLYPYTDNQLPKRPPSLINALEAEDKGSSHAGTFKNIRIVGKGTIDGNGWTRGVKAGGVESIVDELGNTLPQYRASNAKKVGDDGILAKNQTELAVAEGMSSDSAYKNRRSSLMTLRGVSNLYIEGLTILNPAFHGVMVLESENITMNALIHKTFDGNNADGIELGNSQNGLIFNNFFDTGDDGMNFAAGYGKGVETFNQKAQSGAWIFNNYFRKGHGAVVTGSHTGAWIEKITAEDNVMYLTDIGLRMKSRPYYGGGARDVVFRNNAMKDLAKEPFIFTIKYSADVNDTTPATEPAQFRNVTVQDVTIDGTVAKKSILVDGMTVQEMTAAYGITYPRDAYHQNLMFTNVKFRNVQASNITFLHDSQFTNVTFENTDKAWNFAQVSGITLSDSVNNEVISATGKETVVRDAATK